jgi:hypothetical protein
MISAKEAQGLRTARIHLDIGTVFQIKPCNTGKIIQPHHVHYHRDITLRVETNKNCWLRNL